METLTIKTKNKEGLIDITKDVASKVEGKTGICSIFIRNSTAGLLINENEPGLKHDILYFISNLVPDEVWEHDKIDDNASAHLKASIMKHSVFIPIVNGKLQLGSWQSLMLAEFDGPRERQLIVNVIPTK